MLTPLAGAQTYPGKSVRLIVPFAPGGGVDLTARLLAPRLAEGLGQTVVVDNRPGAGGTLGTELGVRAAPDGYTLTMISASYPVNPSLYKLTFDPVEDISAIAQVATGPYLVVVHPSLPVKNIRELIAFARARPGQINYATSGQGSVIHLATELFANMAAIRMNHIPYKGTGPALSDTVGGQTALLFSSIAPALPQVKSGRLRALAVTSAARVRAEPQIPTVAESGVPGYEATAWQGVVGPRGLPRPIVDRLNSETNKVVRMREFEERLQSDGVWPAGGTPDELKALIRREIGQWRDIIARAGIKPE